MTSSERIDYVALEMLKLIVVTYKGEDTESASLAAYGYAVEMEKARNSALTKRASYEKE